MMKITRFSRNGARGFTLIELLVVIAIIGILSSVVLASLNSARQKGRDARRISDIKQLQLALELYYDANAAYPTTLSAANIVTPGYIAALPADPSNAAAYSYEALKVSGSSICSSYHIGASLETSGNSVLASDADASSTVTGFVDCGGTAFDGTDDAACAATGDAGTHCYDILP